MNVYQCVSEPMERRDGRYFDPPEPPEPYAIVRFMAAPTREAARWAAWRTDDDSWEPDPREMPRFSIRKVAEGVDVPAGDVSDDPRFSDLWDDRPFSWEKPSHPAPEVPRAADP